MFAIKGTAETVHWFQPCLYTIFYQEFHLCS